MLKYLFYSLMATIVSSAAFAQQSALLKYKDFVFKTVLIKKDIPYQTNIKPGIKPKYYLLDLYEPETDGSATRPLIIWIHGGGFKYGNKRSAGTPVLSKDFARRGYVCAAVNYRLSKKRPLAKFPDLIEGCINAVEDVQQAVAYFKKNAALYRIDTSRIILAGNSAGGMTALQAVYSSEAAMLHLISKTIPDTASHLYNPSHIAAVASFWGAIFDTAWLQNTRIPIVCIHGSKDAIVPVDHRAAPMYGSEAIHRVADRLNIPNSIKIYQGYGHELQKHFNPFWSGSGAKKRWHDAGDFVAAFLYRELFVKK